MPPILDELFEIYPRSGELYYLRAKFLQAMGNEDEATRHYAVSAELGFSKSPTIELAKRICPRCLQEVSVTPTRIDTARLHFTPLSPGCEVDTFLCLHCGCVSLAVTDHRALQLLRDATSANRLPPHAPIALLKAPQGEAPQTDGTELRLSQPETEGES